MWYAVIADLAGRKFNIVCSNVINETIEYEANIVVNNFKRAFAEAYSLPYKAKFSNMRTTPVQWISDNENQLSITHMALVLLSWMPYYTPPCVYDFS